MKEILLIPNVHIHNANALSSPYTIGFPAMTAWMGFMHALERKIRSSVYKDIRFTGIIVSCLSMNLQTYKGKGDYNYSIKATSNPLDKSGKRPSFIEEARCDIEVTLAIECELGVIDFKKFTRLVDSVLHTMKIAGGDIISFKSSRYMEVDNNRPRELTRYLMPGFCLVSRQELMVDAMNQGKDAIDAMLEYLVTTTEVEVDEKHQLSKKSYKKEKGWIVPIAVGFQGISQLDFLKNARDVTTLHRFAESVVTLGEFKMPFSFTSIDEMLWRYQNYQGNDLYLCENSYSNEYQESKL